MSISKIVKNLRYKSSLGFLIALMLYKVNVFFKYRLFSDRFYIKRNFKLVFGYDLNLNKPETLSEKTQWYKLNYKNPLIITCADKYAVREYVSKTIGHDYLIPLAFHTQNYRDIKPENLPNYPFIIKANHTAGTNHIIKDKSKVDWKAIQNDCRWWLQLNYSYFEKEWQYDKIKPRIVVEKLLVDISGQVPSDYKLFYINGKFEFLQLDIGRFTNHKRNMYDKDWNLLPFTYSTLGPNKEPLVTNGGFVEKPLNFEKLIELGEKLAKPFPFVRVDFYILNEKIYFGELTFHTGGGYSHITPNEWDLYYGNKIPLINNFENVI